jgi:ABC-type uncharacterized transport system ATPase subunit
MTLELVGLRKTFGPVVAVAGVDLCVHPGRVHALVGENGAGKSTLVNLVAGSLRRDAGVVRIDGVEMADLSRRRAVAAGIGVVHQHPSFVETMSVAENVELGSPRRTRRTDLERARTDVRAWAERTGLGVDPDARVESLSIGERQRAEIVAALAWGARYLVLDEPTAVLSPFEADGLLDVVEQLAEDGLAVVLVTHKLREVERSADEVTVMRAGAVVDRVVRGGFTQRSLAAAMIGGTGASLDVAPVRAGAPGPVRLRLAGITAGRLRDVDLTVGGGEIVGVAGVAGNGQRELVDVAVGLRRPERGTVSVDGTDVTGAPAAAVAAGVAAVPDDRDADALALALPVWANVIAKRRDGIGGFRGLDRRLIARLTRTAMARLGVRPDDPAIRTGALSGGNRQRLVIGRELDGARSVVVVAEPTRGLDPASAAAVLRELVGVAEAGAAVLLIASDLDELLSVATRVVVLADGRVRLDAPRSEADRATVGAAMLAVPA